MSFTDSGYYKKLIKRYHIVLVPLLLESSIERIENVKDKSYTILLLDGFDEDRYAMEDYKKRLKTIWDKTELFYKVIITCRTQFFPDNYSEPQYADTKRFGVGIKRIKVEKYYISPFNDKEIQLYLKKKYNCLFEGKKIKYSKRIISNCQDLMIRPMLLAYIDDLLTDKTKQYTTTYEIYKELIFKWIEREDVDNDLLFTFSKKIAEQMYLNKTVYVSKDNIEKLCNEYSIDIKSIVIKSKSLLNRNIIGDYKFAHKSILEYFIANLLYDRYATDNLISWNDINKYEMVRLFLKDKSFLELSKGKENNNFKLENRPFVFCELHNTDFTRMNVMNCEFKDCDFSGSNFSDSNFINVKFDNVYLEKANLQRVNLVVTKCRKLHLKKACLKNAKLEGENLSKVTLEGAYLFEVNLYEADLSFAELTGANLVRSNLCETVLCSAKLEKADLSFANLRGANLRGANLKGAKLSFAKLEGAKLEGANLEGAYLSYTFWTEDDYLKALPQLKCAKFTYIFIYDRERKKIYRNELFPEEK